MTLTCARGLQKSCGLSLRQFLLYPGDRASVSLTVVIMYSDVPTWKWLINTFFTMAERISLITSIFSDPVEIEVVGHLSGDDAQNFIDAIDAINEVSIQSFTSADLVC